jgi:tRNA A-37 threonylcarbamoyl transferase component Bud32
MTAVRWRSGAAPVRAAVERWLAGAAGADARLLRDNARRRLVALRDPAAGELLLKQFRAASGRHPRRERLKALLGRGQAEREERALRALHAAGARVPEPLALGALADGDALLVLRFLPGVPLEEALTAPRAERRRLLARVGAAAAELHRAGFVHGDLHHGNVRVVGGEPVLLDLQHARAARSARARRADLGQLDYALWERASLADRVRLRAAALGAERPFDDAARRALRAVGRAAEARARAHARSRTRRSLRPGRAYAEARVGALRGLRVHELGADALAALVEARAAARSAGGDRVLKDDGRATLTRLAAGEQRVVVKESPFRGLARSLADRLRGSPGRRAWRAGHGLRARGVGAALPLAFLEERRFGLPLRSLVVLEDLSPAPDGLEATARDPAAALDALADLALRLHRRGVHHGDLKCTNVHLTGGARWRARLVDLEGVRFPERLSDAARVEALAQLNASLPDAVPASLRRRAFARYSAALPFGRPRSAVLADVVSRSLARRHRWTGAGCALAGRAGPPTASRPSPR